MLNLPWKLDPLSVAGTFSTRFDASTPEYLAGFADTVNLSLKLTSLLTPTVDPDGDAVKTALRANTEAAIADGVFGVPTFTVDGRAIWGLDALPMLRAALCDQAWFAGPAWDDAAEARAGVVRR